MIQFIEMFKDQFGVESICATLGGTACGFITARGYRAARTRPPSDRAMRDQILIEEIRRIHEQNYSVYGVRKMHAAMSRAGWLVGRDQIARLTRNARIRGISRGRTTVTTTPAAQAAGRFPDLVNRQFTASAPNRLWVADITYVATWSGFAYVAFVTDTCTRKIVGWNVSSRLTTEMLPLHALEMAAWSAPNDLTGLVHHSDQWAVQDSTHQATQALAHRRRGRTRNHGMGQLVQHHPPTLRARRTPTNQPATNLMAEYS